MRREGGQATVSCKGQLIESAHIAVLLEAITTGYGVFLRNTITDICIGHDKGTAEVSS